MAIKSFYAKSNFSNTADSMIIGRSEKRGFIRMSIESEVNFSRPGTSKIYSGTTKDLSATGLRFTTKTAIQTGEKLNISIQPGVSLTPPLETIMTVQRVNKSDNGDYVVAGIIKQEETTT